MDLVAVEVRGADDRTDDRVEPGQSPPPGGCRSALPTKSGHVAGVVQEASAGARVKLVTCRSPASRHPDATDGRRSVKIGVPAPPVDGPRETSDAIGLGTLTQPPASSGAPVQPAIETVNGPVGPVRAARWIAQPLARAAGEASAISPNADATSS